MPRQDTAETEELLGALTSLLEAMRRLSTFMDAVLTRSAERQLTPEEVADVRREFKAARAGLERIDGMVTLRRQRLRPF